MDRSKGAWFSGWLVTKGSDLSGNWGHKGRKGRRGGSMPGGGHAALGYGPNDSKDDIRDVLAYIRAQRPQKKKPDVFPAGQPAGRGRWMEKPVADYMDKQSNNPYMTTQITRDLSASTEIDESPVMGVLQTWASTSNDENLRALSFQEAVSEEFGIPLSSWQQEHLSDARADAAQYEPGSWKRLGKEPALSRDQERNLARAMYDKTQQTLKEMGYNPGETIKVFRGVGGGLQGSPGDTVGLKQNAISSWSVNSDITLGFARRNKPATILAMDVPVESIFSMAGTGIGTAGEGELVVFGVPDNQATVLGTWGEHAIEPTW